jgi:hypothetical protein
MAKDFGKIAHALYFNVPAKRNVGAVSEWMSGWEICELIEEISGLPCAYKQLTAAEVPHLRGNLMVDIVSNTAPWNFYVPGTLTPQQLAGHNYFDLPLTSFRDLLTEQLPRRLEELMNQSMSLKAFVFITDYKPSEQDVRASSEEALKVGYNPPHPVNHNGHDRTEFIGNHPMIERPVSRRKVLCKKSKPKPSSYYDDYDEEAACSREDFSV